MSSHGFPQLLGILLAIGAIGACGGSAADREAPDGYVWYEGSVYAFLHPQDWTPQERGEGDLEVVRVLGEQDAHGSRPGIAVERNPEFADLPIASWAGSFNAQAELALEDREVVGEQDVEVPGATAARLIEVRYRWEDVTMVQHDLLVLEDGDDAVNFRVSAVRGIPG